MMMRAKRFLLFFLLILVSAIFFYVSYEWLCEWLGASSKFRFGLDWYTLLGVSSILSLFFILFLMVRQLKSQ
jgi:hypothetical protein